MAERGVSRIAFYLPTFGRGGVERFVVNISAELVSREVEVDVLTYESSGLTTELPDGVHLYRLRSSSILSRVGSRVPAHVGNALASFPGYLQYLREASPDIVVSMQTSPVAILGARLMATDATFVVRESNTPSVATDDPNHLTGRFAPLAKRITYPRADKVVTVSEDAAKDIAGWLDLPEGKVTVIYNPTYNPDILEMADEPVDHPWFDDDADVPILTSVGRFSDQKDFETLIRAVDRIQTDHEVRLLLVGDGDNRSRLETLRTNLGLDDVIDFVGYQSNPYPYMARADIFVLSSNYEGLPNALIEAITVGTPAIATDCPSGPREILLDGDGGRLVPVGDVEAMAGAIRTYLTDPSEAETRLEAAQEALDRFTPERAASAYLSLVKPPGYEVGGESKP